MGLSFVSELSLKRHLGTVSCTVAVFTNDPFTDSDLLFRSKWHKLKEV